MSSKPHTDTVHKKQRVGKAPKEWGIVLNEEQKQGKATIYSNHITLIKGGAGSGKTLLGVQTGIDGLYKQNFKEIVITRPTVSKEDIGFLPGDMKDKMDPWLQPIYRNLHKVIGETRTTQLIEGGYITILPLAFIRGITFTDAFIIIDEAQNMTHTQTEAILTRLGRNSKMVICGDTAQVDLKHKKESGFSFMQKHLSSIEGFGTVTLEENHRHAIVTDILKTYDEYRD